MMPHPNCMRFVSCAITASTAVEERASNECLRHQGYASAIQQVSKPASSQAFAMATVSCTGSMLSCSTPILKGTVTGVGLLVVVKSNGSGGVGPGVLQSLDELPECSVEGCGHADLVAPAHDGSIHEVDLGLAFGKNILQHAGRMLARRQGSFLHQLPWIAV